MPMCDIQATWARWPSPWGSPLALSSRYALWPAVICVGLTIVRTALEDRTLKVELEGYATYAERVRGRLIPAVW